MSIGDKQPLLETQDSINSRLHVTEEADMAKKTAIPSDAEPDGNMKKPAETAKQTATWAKTMTKVVISQNNGKAPFWHVINFLGPGKCESRGIVDMLAVRKNQGDHELPLNRGDLFEVVLIQVKGGSAKRPTADDRERLRVVKEIYNAKAILLSEWKKGSMPMFYELTEDDWGEPINPAKIFGKRGRPTGKAQSGKTVSKKNSKKELSSDASSAFTGGPFGAKTNSAKKAWVTRKAAQAVASN